MICEAIVPPYPNGYEDLHVVVSLPGSSALVTRTTDQGIEFYFQERFGTLYPFFVLPDESRTHQMCARLKAYADTGFEEALMVRDALRDPTFMDRSKWRRAAVLRINHLIPEALSEAQVVQDVSTYHPFYG